MTMAATIPPISHGLPNGNISANGEREVSARIPDAAPSSSRTGPEQIDTPGRTETFSVARSPTRVNCR